ncbi:MAG TPA: hypothetical protein VFM16_00345, partial [Holophagaceae bacterium]|nr:hypothetical protein [Holophagaceae bacterium]
RIPDRALDGVPCFRLQRMTVKKTQDQAAKAPPQAPAYESRKVYWIDQRTFLILRVEVWTDFGDMRTFQVTRYDAKVNQPVPEAAFAFGAPH